MTEIKPCPFCGSTGTVKPRKDRLCGLHVVCQNVNCQASRLPWQDTPEFAVKVWNTRIASQAPEQKEIRQRWSLSKETLEESDKLKRMNAPTSTLLVD